ncbi:suppressor of tub2 mutation [Tulasnella sp. 403]|nr:suppressor of tub2 mutation [Tulasnella sp. 403]
MAGSDDLDKLIAQCKSNDVDTKVDALNKLQTHFEQDGDLADTDAVIAALKSCLRTPHQHLTTAALLAISPFLRALYSAIRLSSASDHSKLSLAEALSNTETQQLRRALVAFLPSGGIIDRLGDQKEKIRDAAGNALVIAATAAHFCSPASPKTKDVSKSVELPLAVLEKHIKELGLGSKLPRVREQTTLALVAFRQDTPTFPIRPYLPQLVDCLEDTDGSVREIARSSVVTLFTGPQVTDAARADLKNEMAKKGVRKAIVNDILAKLLTGTQSGFMSDGDKPNGEESSATSSRILGQSTAAALSRTTSSGSTPVMGASEEIAQNTPTEVAEVYIASARDLENEFSRMEPCFEGKETEHNWQDRERAIIRLRGMLKGDVYSRYPDVFFAGLKGGLLEKTIKALLSLRTTVSSHACSLYAELAVTMTTGFDPLMETVLTHLLKMGGFTKKIVAQQSQQAVTQILTHTSAHPRFVLPLLWTYLQEKMVQARSYVIGHIRIILEVHASRPAGKAAIEHSGGVDIIDKSIRKGLADANPGVREEARNVYWTFADIWPSQAAALMASLDSVAKKQLEKVNPRPGAARSTPAPPKKSSIAAAIAASRAKAKAIAKEPPTLRHAATSTASANSRGTLGRGDGSPNGIRRVTSPSSMTRAASPHSPRATNGLSSPPVSRSSSPPVSKSAHLRSSTTSSPSPKASPTLRGLPTRSGSFSPSPPTSPTPRSTSTMRRTSSPLVTLSSSTGRMRSSFVVSALPSKALGSPERRPRNSTSSLTNALDADTNELLSAMRIPLPADSDDEESNGPLHVMSFSSAWESIQGSDSIFSVGPPVVPDSVIHESYMAQAQQAESAAAQLLELVKDDDDDMGGFGPLPPNTMYPAPKSAGSSFSSPKSSRSEIAKAEVPSTPKTKATPVKMQPELALGSPPTSSSTLSKVLFDTSDNMGDWWNARKRFLRDELSTSDAEGTPAEQLRLSLTALEEEQADADTMKLLIRMSLDYPCSSPPPSPTLTPQNGMLTPTSPMGGSKRSRARATELWGEEGKWFDKLVKALLFFLNESKPEDVLTFGLVLLYELISNQSAFLTGMEGEIFSFLMATRCPRRPNLVEATNIIRDELIKKSDPILGLAIVHRKLDEYLRGGTVSDPTLADTTTSSYCFALLTIAKFILLLPAEVLEDELPRVRDSLLKAISPSEPAPVREASYAVMIAAQINLRDETLLFTLLSGLTETQKHLLTYEFDKLKTRGGTESDDVGVQEGVLQRFVTRMRRMDVSSVIHTAD